KGSVCMCAPSIITDLQRRQYPNKYSLKIAVTGHRNLGDSTTICFVEQALRVLFEHIQKAQLYNVVALSGLAIGADTIFAETALSQGIPLKACLACVDITKSFAPGLERDRFYTLLKHSYCVHQLPFATCSNTAYMALGYWLVDSCHLLVAVWNGLPSVALGGTGDVVSYAQQCGRSVLHIHTVEKQLFFLS
ncbi:MAG: hypothetical protein AAGF95_35410, partial [Chloroflexota bacterium]